ncbi:MAG: MFS transporter [Deltaproteobacteria bacterium]|jgi:MFS family permease|nr:MFS transporter [Deltaproteobacteria bacterium]MBW2517065.1 MFS transporter [Deltaproteobacteria bacterium]
MVATLISFGALFASALFFLMGGGVLFTQLSLRMTQEGFSTLTIGMTLACYFVGLMCGYFLCHRLIERVGHIRSFAVFAATTTIIIILHGLFISAIFWAILRFFNGITVFGLFMVVESWLNECSHSQTRGRVFSIYMTLTYMGIGIGQQLLNLGDNGGQQLFWIAALLFSLSLIPVSITQSIHPELPHPTRYTFKALFQKVPLGMLGCFASGLVNSAFFSMAPVFGTNIGLSVFKLSWFMSTTVIGGFAVQWLIGIISDRFDRTLVLGTIACFIALLSLSMVVNTGISYAWLLFEMAIFGGLIFAVYPLAVARANDVFAGKEAVAVSSALLLCYSIGAIFGPVLASVSMTLLNTPYGLFVYWSVVAGVFAVMTVYLRRKERIAIIEPAEQVNFAPMRNTSSVAMVLDPRTDAAEDKGK